MLLPPSLFNITRVQHKLKLKKVVKEKEKLGLLLIKILQVCTIFRLKNCCATVGVIIPNQEYSVAGFFVWSIKGRIGVKSNFVEQFWRRKNRVIVELSRRNSCESLNFRQSLAILAVIENKTYSTVKPFLRLCPKFWVFNTVIKNL